MSITLIDFVVVIIICITAHMIELGVVAESAHDTIGSKSIEEIAPCRWRTRIQLQKSIERVERTTFCGKQEMAGR